MEKTIHDCKKGFLHPLTELLKWKAYSFEIKREISQPILATYHLGFSTEKQALNKSELMG